MRRCGRRSKRQHVRLEYAEAKDRLKWDSNRTALYELDCRLRDHDIHR